MFNNLVKSYENLLHKSFLKMKSLKSEENQRNTLNDYSSNMTKLMFVIEKVELKALKTTFDS